MNATNGQLQRVGEDKLSPYIDTLTMQPPIPDTHYVEPTPPRKLTRIKPVFLIAAFVIVLLSLLLLLLFKPPVTYNGPHAVPSMNTTS